MPDSTAQRMIEAGARGADPSMHDLCLRLKGDQQADERFAAMQKQARGCLLSSLRALAESGPSEGMRYPNGERDIPYFDLHREDDAVGIWQAMLAQLIAELEKEPTDAR